MQLTSKMVQMGQVASDKNNALELIAKALTEQGLVADFADALKEREAIANTYLGQGIAIPHGTPAHKEKIKATGVALVHFANGVDWGDGRLVYLAVGIAANNDEHLSILKMLAHLVDDDGLEAQLKTVKTADELLTALGQAPNSDDNQALKAKQDLTPYFLETQAKDWESLLTLASQFLSQKQAVSSGFLTSLLTKPIIYLTQGVGLVQSSVAALKPMALAISLSNALTSKQNAIHQLLVLTDNGVSAGELIDKILQSPPKGRDDWRALFGQDDFVYAEAVLANHHGLHARPATALSQVANGFAEDIQISLDNEHFVSAKSLVRLLALGAEYGATLYIRTPKTGNANERLSALTDAIKAGLGEEIQPIKPIEPIVLNDKHNDEVVPSLVANQRYYGMVASAGLCVAKAYVIKEYQFDFERFADNADEQKQRLNAAISEVATDLDKIVQTAKTVQIAEIFKAHRGILDDGEIIAGVHRRIDEGLSAAMAWHSEIGALANAQAMLDNPILAERAADLRDIGQRVLANLCGVSVSPPQGKYVLIKDDLLPSDVATLGDQVSAIVTAFGGMHSHSAIIARSLGIPALVGVGATVLEVAQGQMVLVEAQEGYFIASPDEETITNTETQLAKLKYKQNIAKINAHEPAKTLDGHQLEVAVNLGDVTNVGQALELGAEGVGLLRTEFVFMKHTAMPTIAKQKTDYSTVFEAMGKRPVVVRTLDVGGDKPLPYLAMNKEDNPFLGVRGVRLTLRKPDVFKDQLIALIEASNDCRQKTGIVQPLKIMFPMIGQLEEWYNAKAILNEVLATHPHDNLQVGMMIEIPSAAILAQQFAKEVDFFSIGTNDLTQYTLAIDRGHPVLSTEADGLDPSVLKLIEMTVKAAHANGKWVGVCGELAADSEAVPVLVGLGVDELSVSASQIPLVKMQIRTLQFAKCQELATQALLATSGEKVRQLVKQTITGEL